MRFTIRDVVWLTVVVGLGIALWIERTQHAELREYVRRLREWTDGLEFAISGEGYVLDGDWVGFVLKRPAPEPSQPAPPKSN
jgi:hypothetical protein